LLRSLYDTQSSDFLDLLCHTKSEYQGSSVLIQPDAALLICSTIFSGAWFLDCAKRMWTAGPQPDLAILPSYFEVVWVMRVR
jgi:hypothetical protein